jgi:hypothetical protein
MSRRRGPFLVVAALAMVACAWAGPAGAAKPTTQVIQVDEIFDPDEFLSAECGVEVTTRIVGTVRLREFDRTKGTIAVNNINLTGTATAGDNVARFKDVGADHTRITPDGQLIVSIIGQVPFEFKGVLKIDPDTGEVFHEPSAAYGTEKICARLTA